MGMEAYLRAKKEGQREVHARQSRDEDTTLPVLSELVPELNRLTQVSLGLVQIPFDRIVGTATRGRTTAFAPNFMPLLDSGSEFAFKWSVLYDDVVENGLRDPVTAYEYYNHFYIIEGNKRVSVMHTLDCVYIEGNVTRILPEPEDSERYRVYQEFLRFYADSKINFINFSHEGCFEKLYALLGKTPGEAWTESEISDLQSCYHRFAQAYGERTGTKAPLEIGDALLVYLDVFGYADSKDNTPAEFGRQIAKVFPEFVVAAAKKPAALLNEPSEKQLTLLSSVLRRVPNPLRCAFVYNHSPQVGGWTYSHELGRKALEQTFGDRIETTTRENVDPQMAERVIDELAQEGYHVIFTASPVLLGACIKQSVAHPQIKILNCSLLASYHNVRSYYLRIYEAKFVLGAIAGAMAEDDKIGYIADYPIYGAPASINAFALGAQLTNPRAKVYLEWSSLPGSNPEKALAQSSVHIISSRDISAPLMQERTFGLYQINGEQISNLAAPVWNWSRCYEGIVRSILTGAWSEDQQLNADRALSYYMGMSSDAIDLICSKRLPVRVRRLVDLLHERIRSDAFLPFVGPIVDQAGELRVADGETLIPQEIIAMNYLAGNVIGRIPDRSELLPVAQSLVALQGLSKAQRSVLDARAKDE